MRRRALSQQGEVDLDNLYPLFVCVAVGLLIWLCVWGYQKANEPPIQTSFRGSLLFTDGKVLQVRNTGSVKLVCCVEMVGVRGDQRRKYRFTVDPGEREEIGVLEGDWNVERNESVTLYTDGYTTLKFTVP